MKRTIIILTLTTAILLAAAQPAGATHPEAPPANDAAAPNTEDCRPGGDSHIVGPWEMMNQDQYELMLLEGRGVSAHDPLPGHLVHPGGDDGIIDTWGELAHEAATATWEFCAHNYDGLACVMKQTFPDGGAAASGFGVVYTILDNHPFPG